MGDKTMHRQFKVLSRRGAYFMARLALILLLAGGASSCAADYSEEKMQPLAAPVYHLAQIVRDYSSKNPSDAANLNNQELVLRAAAKAPVWADASSLLKPLGGYMVKGRPEGVILVCTDDGKRGLIEDAACSIEMDSPLWRDDANVCEFKLDLAAACPAN